MLEILNRQLDLIKVFPYRFIDECYDTEGKKGSKVEIVVDDIRFFEIYVERNYFCFVEKNLFIIDDFEFSNNKVTLKLFSKADIFERDILVLEEEIEVETFIKQVLENEFVKNKKAHEALLLEIITTSKTKGLLVVNDNIISFSDLWRQILRIYNIEIKVKLLSNMLTKKIQVTIGKQKQQIAYELYEKSSFIYDVNKKMDTQQATRFTYITPTKSYAFFLKNNGEITQNINDSDIVPLVVDKKKYSKDELSFEKILAEANKELVRTYNTEIILKTSEAFYHELQLNQDCIFISKNKQELYTKVSSKTKKDKVFEIVLGSSRTRLTDKLRKKI